ncbi:HK97 gp10 family phage protein [Cupriavidus taiwanensis]|uniref:HK97 gp10 family phage protein n=1 Tax=Cupriavidus taiwanensis TaxID=164546 RepID=UPI000E1752A1|nr:HK97 gp10 family phage protein [Cupriavidus taiwanensis]SPA17254.1 Phage protein, HK97 gp10 family [Cupriavidus taiwanensis]
MPTVAEIKGLKEFDEFMKTLPEEIQRKFLAGALYAGAKPVVDAAAKNVQARYGSSPRYTGTLARGITRSRTNKTRWAAQVNVKLRKGKSRSPTVIRGVRKQWGDDPFYGRYLEFGTSRGIQGTRWLLDAATSMQGEVGARVRLSLVRRVNEYCRKEGVKFTSPV